MTSIERDDPMRRVSIVLPVGLGDRAWPPLYAALRTHADAADIRVVFVEGDTQTTPNDASGATASTRLYAPRGRAKQQNAGASGSSRQWLWFLHADSRPDADVFAALRDFLIRDEAALGWFRLRFDAHESVALNRRMRINAAGANWRSRRFGLPFGDQGLVLPTAAFARLGGFDTTLPYGEDFALVWRAQRSGLALRELPATLCTSARKYADRGWLRTTARHLRLTASLAWREARR
jgi:hypothetical protein